MEGTENQPGLIPNAFRHIFDAIQKSFSEESSCLIQASMLEIYNEDVRDLLGKNHRQKLDLKEDPQKGIYVKDLSCYVVKSVKEIEKVMNSGKANREVGATDMNQDSSRSHCVFIVKVETKQKSQIDGKDHIRVGTLNMVDLAGSERSKKTKATGIRAKEGININLSLSSLGQVIFALAAGDKKRHIPYRNSKLTRLLQTSLGGNAKTVMLAAFSPADYNYDETMSTLRYATACKKIKNQPKVNQDPKDTMLQLMQEQIEKLRRQLEEQEAGKRMELSTGESHATRLRQLLEANDLEKEKLRQEIEQKSQKEKEELMKRQTFIDEERIKVEQELRQQEEEIAKSKQEEEELRQKMKQIQNQVIYGGVNLIEATKQQQARIQRLHEEVLERQKQEEELEKLLEKQDEERLDLEQNYASKQEEVQQKTKKIKKLWTKYQASKNEVQELEFEFQKEREDYLYTIRQLDRDLKLKMKIVDYFIPKDIQDKIQRVCFWNEGDDEWILPNRELTGNYIHRQHEDEYSDENSQEEVDFRDHGQPVYFSYADQY